MSPVLPHVGDASDGERGDSANIASPAQILPDMTSRSTISCLNHAVAATALRTYVGVVLVHTYNSAHPGRGSPDGQIVVLFNPRLDNWQDHFRWSHDCTRIIGHTAFGRATLKALRLNRRL